MTKQEVIQKLENIKEQNIGGISIPLDSVIEIVKDIEGGIDDEGELILEWLRQNLKDIVESVRETTLDYVEEHLDDSLGEDHDISLIGREIQIDSIDIDHSELKTKVVRSTRTLFNDILEECEEKLTKESVTE